MDNNEKIRFCAQAAHEMNRVYCQAVPNSAIPAMPHWEACSAEQQATVIDGVLKALGPEATPEASHSSWLAAKATTGWKYGPVKDEAKKEHPCMLPYDQLPVEQQMKDRLYIQTVKLMANVLQLHDLG